MERIEKIRKHFGMPRYLSVNYETPCTIDDESEDWEVLKETERRGFIEIRDKPMEVPALPDDTWGRIRKADSEWKKIIKSKKHGKDILQQKGGPHG